MDTAAGDYKVRGQVLIPALWLKLDVVILLCSIARCLGAKRVSQKSFEWLSNHSVTSHVVTDKEAVSACVHLADDHRVLIPPSCGAAVAAVYSDVIPELQKSGQLPRKLDNVVIIVCGGSEVSLETIKKWRGEFKI